ncbi:MAG: CRISPR-associated protein Cas4 [Deltaproteobacteria bacterium]|nr:CRISPR-associated protein Cas4 [Deltaproteobacteria bacterium]
MAEIVSWREAEDEPVPISALNQYSYCPRRCALIHIEQLWDENRATAEGRIMHERVHEQDRESRGHVRIEYGLPLRTLRLGLIGKADVVEFHRVGKDMWQPFPVEYKRGKPKHDHCDLIQLCAQALCLEEMLSVSVPEGAIFYGRTRRRLDVTFDNALRLETEETVDKVRQLINAGKTPPPVYEKRCKSCSLVGECMPRTIEKKSSVKRYLTRMIESA